MHDNGSGTPDTTIVDRLRRIAAERRPDDSVLGEFLPAYYHELPAFDIDERSVDDLYAAAVAHLALGRGRGPGDTAVVVFAPDCDRDGWHSDRSVVLVVTDDAPFLVDTLRIVLERHRVATHLLVHPMLHVRRDDDGALVEMIDGEGGRVEAWTQVEIDRLDAAGAEALRRDLVAAIADVHRVVADFPAMRDRMRSLAALDPLLGWLADNQMVFLGAATYSPGDAVGSAPVLVTGSELGQMRLDGTPDPEIDLTGAAVSVARSARTSTIHRASRYAAVTVLVRDDSSTIVRVERFIGLLASTAYRQSVLDIPSVGDRARAVLGLASDGAQTHTGRSMRNVLETLPRDLVFELDADRLATLVIDVVGLQERQIVRVFEVPEPVGNFSTVLVYLPKSRFSAQLPEQVAGFVAATYAARAREVESLIGTSSLARITFSIERTGRTPDLDEVSEAVDDLTTSWLDRVRDAAGRQIGEARASQIMARVGDSAPAAFRTTVDPTTAVGDLLRLVELLDGDEAVRTALVHAVDAEPDVWRLRVYRRGEPFALSNLFPLLGHLGLHVLDEHPYEFLFDDETCHLYDIGVRLPAGVRLDEARHAEVLATFEALLSGRVEADGFNRLVLLGGLSSAQVHVLRAYAKYAQQIGFAFSQGYVEGTLSRLPALARQLVDLFEAKFDPDGDRHVEPLDALCTDTLDAVPSLDDDRIGRTFLTLIRATVRTSAYQGKPTLALKFDPSLIPDLPKPVPAHEIFVCSADVEGVHLRGGPIARGGLRWSDRPEDYRTEVLGLVKAQMVKNAVIVPVGAKGGFVVKRPPSDPAALRAAGLACYRAFVAGLLDVTDNLVGGAVVPPPRTVRYDGDDPYLVVAADKGTATFSDVANEIAAEYGFWLGDAFASGGSAGYDHKEMGITARGAWESVRRSARVIGKDADADELTFVGIGDMSGDVFGNGMLRSRHLKLVAAFDHRHVFVDPDPDPARSFAERRRLYEMPRSSWADYDPSLISPGGGVFARTLKSIELSPQMRNVLDVADEHMTPNELIVAILRAPVDVLWNGGIGTYVKASGESSSAVGDRANDAVRVDGRDLRCRIVAEGGNLGLTQLGRVEYALAGGLVNTDAIDNSAGVDCSDHEVNIKILLDSVVADGELTLKQRNQLLEEMTDEVAELVLRNNRAQTLALMIARTQSLPMANVHARYLDQLELEGWIDRSLEFLPTDKQLSERQSMGSGMRVPEFAVMIAYTKNADISEILESDLPDDPALVDDLVEYFPTPLQQRYRPEIMRHPLRREIAATMLVNSMVNLSGISYDHRMTEDTGASVADVARAWLVAREILDFPAWWAEIDSLSGVALGDQLEVFLDCRRTAERCSMWFLRHRRPPIDISAEVKRFRDPVRQLEGDLAECLSGPIQRAMGELAANRAAQGVPAALAHRSAVWRLLHTAFDVVEVADRAGVAPVEAAKVYWSIFDRLDLLWLWDAIGTLPRADRWQTQARGSLRDELLSELAALTESVFEGAAGSTDAWFGVNSRTIERACAIMTQIRRGDSFDVTNLSVALRQLRNLALMAPRGA